MAGELRDVDFPVAMRGYDRSAVDRYVEQVNRVIAELEVSASPESAVRHALEEVTEETRGLLERAQETAEEITARSRARADDRLQQGEREAEQVRQAAARDAEEVRERAQREARELTETAARETQQMRASTEGELNEMLARAEARVRELDRSAHMIWRERQQLIENLGEIAKELQGIAEAERERFEEPLDSEPASGPSAADRAQHPAAPREADPRPG
jgi:DivIVA domain-containing protein